MENLKLHLKSPEEEKPDHLYHNQLMQQSEHFGQDIIKVSCKMCTITFYQCKHLRTNRISFE